MTLTYAANASGVATLTLRATDTAGDFVETTLDVTVAAVNDVPTTTGLGDLHVDEDSAPVTIDLYDLFDDIEDTDSQLTYDIAANSDPTLATGTVDASTGTATLTLAPDAYGLTSLTFRATDTDGATVEFTVDLVVAAVNDAPMTTGPATVTVPEDSSPGLIDLAGLFGDVDDAIDTLTYTIVTRAGDAVVIPVIDEAVAAMNLYYIPDASGDLTLTVRATDPSGAYAETDLTVTVTPVDDDPALSVPGTQTVNQDAEVVFGSGLGTAISIVDADGGDVVVTLSVLGGTLSLSGTDGLTFLDGDGSSDTSVSFVGSVASVNAALDGLRFAPAAGFEGFASLEIRSQAAGSVSGDEAVARLGVLVLEAVPTALPTTAEGPGGPLETPQESSSVKQASSSARTAGPADATAVFVPTDVQLRQIGLEPSADNDRLPEQQPADAVEPPDVVRSASSPYLSSITERLLALRAAGQPGVLVLNDLVFDALDILKKRIDASGSEELAEAELYVTVASGVTLTLSAGFVTWMMRAGSLLTSLLSTSPVWRGFDPLPVLGTGRDDDDELFLDQPPPDDRAETLFSSGPEGTR